MSRSLWDWAGERALEALAIVVGLGSLLSVLSVLAMIGFVIVGVLTGHLGWAQGLFGILARIFATVTGVGE